MHTIDWFAVGAALIFATAIAVWSFIDRITAHLPIAVALFGGLLVGAALSRCRVLVMVPAGFAILLVGGAMGLI